MHIAIKICVIDFYELSDWDGCWSLVSIYESSNVRLFDCITVAGSAEGWALKPHVNHTGWTIALTDRH